MHVFADERFCRLLSDFWRSGLRSRVRNRGEDFNINEEKFVEKPELTPVTFC